MSPAERARECHKELANIDCPYDQAYAKAVAVIQRHIEEAAAASGVPHNHYTSSHKAVHCEDTIAYYRNRAEAAERELDTIRARGTEEKRDASD